MSVGIHLLRVALAVAAVASLAAVSIEAATSIGTCSNSGDVCTMEYSDELKPWLHDLYVQTVEKRKSAESHPFIAAISAGEISKTALVNYFQGMYWHGHLFISLHSQRPPSVGVFIASIKGRVSDGHSSEEAKRATEDSFDALITAVGGDFEAFKASLDTFSPPYEWFLHNAQLRAAIYSADFSWEVGTAAMSAGTEGVVPWYCGPLAAALETGYGIQGTATNWLRVRGGEEAKRHADNGFKVLSHFLSEEDPRRIAECSLYIDRLALSMSKTLLDCGLRLAAEDGAVL